jgi:hypothetical protein
VMIQHAASNHVRFIVFSSAPNTPFAARLLYMGFKSGIWSFGVRQLAAAFYRRACSADSTNRGPTSCKLAVEKWQQAAALQSFAIGSFRGLRREAQGRQEPG